MKIYNILFLLLVCVLFSKFCFSQDTTITIKKEQNNYKLTNLCSGIDFNANINKYTTGGLGYYWMFTPSKCIVSDCKWGINIIEYSADILFGSYEQGNYFGGLSMTNNLVFGKVINTGLTISMFNSDDKILYAQNTSFTPFVGVYLLYLSVNIGYEYYPFINGDQNDVRLPHGLELKIYFRPTSFFCAIGA